MVNSLLLDTFLTRRLELVHAFLYALYLTLYKTDVPLDGHLVSIPKVSI